MFENKPPLERLKMRCFFEEIAVVQRLPVLCTSLSHGNSMDSHSLNIFRDSKRLMKNPNIGKGLTHSVRPSDIIQ